MTLREQDQRADLIECALDDHGDTMAAVAALLGATIALLSTVVPDREAVHALRDTLDDAGRIGLH